MDALMLLKWFNRPAAQTWVFNNTTLQNLYNQLGHGQYKCTEAYKVGNH
ncbi:MAG: hypothetical protein IPG38_15860 [Chitinophagaceae bacterium]|nr:hypothetical protein [Chitinophagaceae bacterium]